MNADRYDAGAHVLETQLEIEGVSGFHVIAATLTEGLSERSRCEVVVASHDDLDTLSALGKPARLIVEGLAERTWTLVLAAASFIEQRGAYYHYLVELVDPLSPLELTKNTRKFRGMSAREIVSAVLSEHGVRFDWRLVREPATRNYCSQYRESNLAFIERLLEFEGIHYRFDADGSVIFVDDSPSAPHAREGHVHELIEAEGALAHGDVGVHALTYGVRTTTGRVTLGDYNWKRAERLRETGWGERDTALERYEYPAGFRSSEQGALQAKMRCEAYRATAVFLEGKSSDPSLQAGLAIKVGGPATEGFDGAYLLVRVTHTVNAGDSPSGAGVEQRGTYSNSFHSIPLDRPFRPLPKTPRPTIDGTHTAMVRGPAGEEIHTDRHGRFRAQFHWDREGTGSDVDSRWLRMLQEASSSMVLARTGWEVLVGYIDGDPDRPIGVGRIINAHMAPSYSLPSNKNMMTIKTPSSPATGGFSEIKMDDSAGAQHISIRAEKDHDAIIRDNKTEAIGNDETHTVASDFKREIFGDQLIQIGANDTATYDATSELKLASSRSVRVSGSETVDIAAAKKVTISKSEDERVGSVRLSIVGRVVMPDFKAMARSALQGLKPKNPFAGLIDAAKKGNPLKGLAASLRTKVKAELGKLEPQALRATAADAAADVLSGVGEEAWKRSKEAFKKDRDVSLAIRAALDPLDPREVHERAVEASMKKVEETVKEVATNIKDAPREVVSSYVRSVLPELGGFSADAKFEGPGGFLPSVAQLQQWYSAEAIKKGLVDQMKGLVSPEKLKGVLSQATGGLSDILIPQKDEKGERTIKFGWDEADKIINLFSTGGISRSPEASMRRLVGGAQIQAALGNISWGSKVVWAETVGAVKLSKTPKSIEQKVKGRMQVTVLGKVIRTALDSIAIQADESAVTVGKKASYEASHSAALSGKEGVTIKASDEALVEGGKASSIKLTKGAAVLKGKKVGIETSAKLVLSGRKLNVSKG